MFTLIKQLKGKIIANKSSLIKIAVFLGIYLLFSEFSFADDSAGADATKTAQSTFDKAKNTVAEVTVWISTMVSLLLGLMTYLVTMFLSPEWTNGSLFGMNSKFKEIWIFVSNFVYLAFAFILIAIAFMNIIGKGEGNFAFKQAIPRFILGILIVPFSWFLVNFLVSLSSILFVGAMNLPSDIFTDYNKNLDKITVPKNCTIDLKNLTDNTKKDDGKEVPKSIYDCGEKDEKGNYKETVSLKDVLGQGDASSGVFGIMSTYTYGILNLSGFDKLNTQEVLDGKLNTIGDIVVHVVFNLLFIVVYALLMIALGLAVMIRGIWLWIYIMLSPLMGLMIFFGKAPGGKFFEKFNFSEFIALAMVPVYSMLALSFGLLFIFVVNDGLGKNEGGQFQDSTVKIEKTEGNNQTKLKIGGGGEGKNFTLTIDGAISENAESIGGNVIGSGLGIIGNLILKIFGIVVLWGTVMAALKSSKITEEIIAPIASFGENIGKAVSSLPQYTPILPGGQSLESLKHGTSTITSSLQSKYGSERGNKFANKIIGKDTLKVENIDDFKAGVANSSLKSNQELQRNILNYMTRNFDTIKENGDERKVMNSYLEKMGAKTRIESSSQVSHLKEALNEVYNLNDIVKPIINQSTLKSGNNYDLDSLIIQSGTKPAPEEGKKTSTITLNQEGKLSQDIKIKLNGSDFKIDTNSKVSDQIKAGLGENNGVQNKISKDTLEAELKRVGLSDDIINQVIDSLRNDGRIINPNPTPSNPRQ